MPWGAGADPAMPGVSARWHPNLEQKESASCDWRATGAIKLALNYAAQVGDVLLTQLIRWSFDHHTHERLGTRSSQHNAAVIT